MSKNIAKINIKLAWFILAVIAILALLGTMIYLFVPISIDVKLEAIEKVGTSVHIRQATATTPLSLYKTDKEGEISADSFKILAFTDTHLDTYRKKGAYTIKYLIENIQKEQPDLVVFVGDVVTSATNGKRVNQLIQIMEKLEVYWIPVLGNHEGDNWRSISRQEFIKSYSVSKFCLVDNNQHTTSDGEKVWGYGNTQINILTTGGAVSQSLFFLDSGDRVSKADAQRLGINKDSYDFVKTSQIKWYKERILALDDGVKSMLFLHIPLYEYTDAADAAPKNIDSGFKHNVVAEDGTMAVFGSMNEKISCSEYNNGFFNEIVALNSTQAIVCSHDHINDFRILYKGIMLCYNRSSGYSSYNMVTRGISDKFTQGASTYTINLDGSIDYGDIINDVDTEKLYKLYRIRKK